MLRVRAVFLLSLSAIALACPVARAQPNNGCGGAIAIPSLPYTATVLTGAATIGVADPVPSCGTADNNVWYSYTAPRATSLHVETSLSSYCTTVAIYTGACGALTEIGCGASSGVFSCNTYKGQVIVPLNTGDSVLIAVSSTPAGGGTLLLTASQSSPAYLNRRSLREPIVASDTSPLGGSYGRFTNATLLSKRDLAFAADSGGVFVRSGGVLTTIAVPGDPAPIGGRFAQFGPPSINDAGTVVFHARIDGAAATSEGIFAWSGGVISALVREGDAAPGGGTYTSFDEAVVVNQNGAVAFHGRSSTFPTQEALFVDDGVAARRVVKVDDASPCGDTFRTIAASDPRGFAISDTTTAVAFAGSTSSGDDGIFYEDGAGAVAVVCQGDAAPGGGTQSRIGLQPAVNGLGDVWFVTTVSGGGTPDVLWRWNGGALTRDLETGDVLDSGETVEGLHYRQEIGSNVNGFLAFRASVSPGRDAIVLRDGGAPIGNTVATEGDACPTGGTFGSIDLEVAVSSAGDVAFRGSCPNGSGTFSAALGGAPIATGTALDATAIGAGFDFRSPQVNAAGDSALHGFRTGLYTAVCPLGFCGPVTALAAAGDPVPGMLGQHFDAISSTSFNGRGREKAFTATTAGASGRLATVIGAVNNFLFRVATVGDTLPGGIGTFVDFPDATSFGDVAQPSAAKALVAFYAHIDGHPLGGTEGIYLRTLLARREIAVEGGVSPTGGIFTAFGRPALRKRELTFRATTTLDDCLYGMNAPAGALTVLACTGDAVPAPVGGTLDLLDAFPSGARNAAVFASGVSGGGSYQCLFTRKGGAVAPAECVEEPYILGSYIHTFSFASAPAAEMDSKGFVYVQDDAHTIGGPYRSLVAVRKGKHYPMFSAQYERSPISNGEYRYDPLAPPAMFGKTVAFASQLRDGAATSAVFMGFVP